MEKRLKWRRDRLAAIESERVAAEAKRMNIATQINTWLTMPKAVPGPPLNIHKEGRVPQAIWAYRGPMLGPEVFVNSMPELQLTHMKGRQMNNHCLLWLRFAIPHRRQRMHRVILLYNQYVSPEKQVIFEDFDGILPRKAWSAIEEHPYFKAIEAKPDVDWVEYGCKRVRKQSKRSQYPPGVELMKLRGSKHPI